MAPPEPVEAAGRGRKVWRGLWACGSWDKAGLSFWKFEQKSDRQGCMGAGRAGERQVEGLGVLGRGPGGHHAWGRSVWLGAPHGGPEGQAGTEGRAGLSWSCPEVGQVSAQAPTTLLLVNPYPLWPGPGKCRLLSPSTQGRPRPGPVRRAAMECSGDGRVSCGHCLTGPPDHVLSSGPGLGSALDGLVPRPVASRPVGHGATQPPRGSNSGGGGGVGSTVLRPPASWQCLSQ